jgi:hypothetical protein
MKHDQTKANLLQKIICVIHDIYRGTHSSTSPCIVHDSMLHATHPCTNELKNHWEHKQKFGKCLRVFLGMKDTGMQSLQAIVDVWLQKNTTKNNGAIIGDRMPQHHNHGDTSISNCSAFPLLPWFVHYTHAFLCTSCTIIIIIIYSLCITHGSLPSWQHAS